MSEKKNSLFRKSSLDKVSSPEQLNEYIRVTNPSVWLILGAICILLVAVLVWSFLGTLPTTVTVSAIAEDGRAVAYLPPEEAAALRVGMRAAIGGASGAVESIGETPLSYDEAASVAGGDYFAYALGLSAWNTRVVVAPDAPLAGGGLMTVVITADETSPASFLFN